MGRSRNKAIDQDPVQQDSRDYECDLSPRGLRTQRMAFSVAWGSLSCRGIWWPLTAAPMLWPPCRLLRASRRWRSTGREKVGGTDTARADSVGWEAPPPPPPRADIDGGLSAPCPDLHRVSQGASEWDDGVMEARCAKEEMRGRSGRVSGRARSGTRPHQGWRSRLS